MSNDRDQDPGFEREVDERIAAFVDDALSEKERERFVAELRVSPQLRRDLDEYERTVDAVRRALRAETKGVDVAGRVMAALAREATGAGREDEVPPRPPLRGFRLLARLAAAAALLLFALWIHSLAAPEPPTTDTAAHVENRDENRDETLARKGPESSTPPAISVLGSGEGTANEERASQDGSVDVTMRTLVVHGARDARPEAGEGVAAGAVQGPPLPTAPAEQAFMLRTDRKRAEQQEAGQAAADRPTAEQLGAEKEAGGNGGGASGATGRAVVERPVPDAVRPESVRRDPLSGGRPEVDGAQGQGVGRVKGEGNPVAGDGKVVPGEPADKVAAAEDAQRERRGAASGAKGDPRASGAERQGEPATGADDFFLGAARRPEAPAEQAGSRPSDALAGIVGVLEVTRFVAAQTAPQRPDRDRAAKPKATPPPAKAKAAPGPTAPPAAGPTSPGPAAPGAGAKKDPGAPRSEAGKRAETVALARFLASQLDPPTFEADQYRVPALALGQWRLQEFDGLRIRELTAAPEGSPGREHAKGVRAGTARSWLVEGPREDIEALMQSISRLYGQRDDYRIASDEVRLPLAETRARKSLPDRPEAADDRGGEAGKGAANAEASDAAATMRLVLRFRTAPRK